MHSKSNKNLVVKYNKIKLVGGTDIKILTLWVKIFQRVTW